MVVCYGLFEQFVRNLLERAVISINKGVKDIESISESVILENIYLTGSALRTVRNPRKYLNFDYNQLGQNLGVCVAGRGTVNLNAICFSMDHGTMDSNCIDALFGRIGLKLNWDRIGGNKELQKLLGVTGIRDCTNEVRSKIDDFTEKRNYIAHTGGLEIVMSNQEFELLVEFLSKFGPLFRTHLSDEIGTVYR